jgi:hypothetical protein
VHKTGLVRTFDLESEDMGVSLSSMSFLEANNVLASLVPHENVLKGWGWN